MLDFKNKEKKLKILIAEDDYPSELYLTIIVKVFCKEIFKVRTGIEAVEICRKNPDIDLILMDIHMAEMDGYGATREIRQFNKSIVIIAQTAYASEKDKEDALIAGCNDYLTKPVSKEKLHEIIEKYFFRI